MRNKLKMTFAVLIVFSAFIAGLAYNNYRQHKSTTVTYKVTEYENGIAIDSSQYTQVQNSNGEWSGIQTLSDGTLKNTKGKVTPSNISLNSGQEGPQLLGRKVVVVINGRNEGWVDPTSKMLLKSVLYADDARQVPRIVIEAEEIKW